LETVDSKAHWVLLAVQLFFPFVTCYMLHPNCAHETQCGM
jgi:hypothetical protein